MNTYHPEPEMNMLISEEANQAEVVDLKAGYPPRWWQCNCGASHNRGYFENVGNHRCLKCGYVGIGGVLLDEAPTPNP